MIVNRLYTSATVLIIVGLVMLCQPFSLFLHVCALPVFLGGFVLFIVLDHLPDVAGRRRRKSMNKGRAAALEQGHESS